MVDHVSAGRRRANMQAIRSHSTTPEMTVRRVVHGMGFRYRLHAKHLPGKPDLVFGPRKKVIFVHGCFWHQHDACKGARLPASNLDYWKPKMARNRSRDAAVKAALEAAGWEVMTVWECQISDTAALAESLRHFLQPESAPALGPAVAGPRLSTAPTA